MYGLWLYKELKTEYGNCKVELYRKGYTASAVEIGGFVGNSLNLALENLDTITAPIGKSVCSFAIYDTEQVEYDNLFTPDATAYKVVVSTKVDGGEYNTRWSGYVTPDFFAENLSFRTPISISARDNIGYLNDVDFDLDTATITVRELIQAAFNRIAEDYPMSLSFVSQKQTAEGILAIDATISTYLLREMSWYEALETVLHDLGLQMRWVDNNTIAVLDISQLGENFGIQRFNFIERSGYREILPAWRELSQKQDYGLIENFFRGRISEENLTFVKEEQVVIDGYNTSTMRYYSPKNWLGNGLTINYNDYFFSVGGVMSESERNRIYFTGISKDTTAYINKFIGWRQPVYKSNNAMKVSFKALNSIQVVSQYSLQGMPTLQTFGPYPPGTAQFGLKVNVLLHTATKTYIMRYKWEELNADETDAINFVLPVLQGNANEEECVIDLGNIPYDGELELRIYGWYFIEATNWTSMPLNAVSYITDVVYSYDGSVTGQNAKVTVAELHNIKEDRDYSFGQVPLDSGGINAYAGGLFKANGDELVGFRRNANSTTYPLLELVGREIIHFNKKNYNKLSGTIKNLAKEPLRFDKVFIYKGKNYLPFAYSLDVISNTMSITTMQEVEPYMTHSFVEIKSELVTGGGATVSGGNNTALQYSAEVGNAKRISELNNASESEKKESYIVIDNANWNESKKVPLSEMEGLNAEQVEEYLTENKYAKQSWVESKGYALATDVTKLGTRVGNAESAISIIQATYVDKSSAQTITGVKTFTKGLKIGEVELTWDGTALRISKGIVVNGGGAFGGGSTSGGGGTSGGLGRVTIKTEAGVEYSTNENGLVTVPNWITSAALNGYATEAWVNNKRYLTQHQDISHLLSKNTAAATYLPLSGGTITGRMNIKLDGWPFIAYYNSSTLYGFIGFSDVGVPSMYNGTSWNTLIHSGNYSSYALPLSGGKMTGYIRWQDDVNGNDIEDWAAERTNFGLKIMSAGGGSTGVPATYATALQVRGRYGFQIASRGGETDMFYIKNIATESREWKELIHSGNIGSYNAGSADVIAKTYSNQSINFARNESKIRLIRITNGDALENGFPSQYVSGISVLSDYTGWQMVTYGNIGAPNPFFRSFGDDGRISEWKQLAFLTDNVASATKLQIARTIWGQSFDGTKDVSGNLILGYNKIYLAQDNENYYLGWNGNTELEYTNYYGHIFKTGGAERMRITTNGNVLIGATEDNGAKLQVDGDVHIKGNLIVEGGGAFGTGSTTGGGTSGGLGSVTIKTEGGIEYKSNSNGVVIVPNWITASALNGYATESWVNNKGYITGITSSMVTTALGYTPYNSASFTKANIKSTLGIADWALAATKPTYTASEVGALSVSGGTLTGASSTLLVINRTSGTPLIQFKANGTSVGYLGVDTNSLPCYVNPVTFDKYILIHSGNYSSYTLPLTGGTINGTLEINHNGTYPLIVNGADSYSVLQFTARSKREAEVGWLNDDRGSFAFLFNVNSMGALSVNAHGVYFAPTASDFAKYPILHSNNYESYTYSQSTIDSKLAGYLPLKGGVISAASIEPLMLNNTIAGSHCYMHFQVAGVTKAYVGWSVPAGAFLQEGSDWLSIKGGAVCFNANPLIHTGNYADTTDKRYLQLSGGTISGSTAYIFSINRTSNDPVIAYYANSSLVGFLGISTTGSPIYITNAGTPRNLIHTGNYADTTDKRYLQLSGGTIAGGHLTLANSARIKMNNGLIELNDGNGTNSVYLGNARNMWGENESKNLCIYDGSSWYRAIHSGNYSSYALPLSGGKMTGYIRWQDDVNGNDIEDWAAERTNFGLKIMSAGGGSTGVPATYATALQVRGRYGFQIASRGGETDMFYIKNIATESREWKELIHSGNIGSYNAGSATKLQTARTIWGQSFDGTGNVSGDIHLNQSDIYWYNDKVNYCIESVPREAASPYLKIAHFGGIRFNVSGAENMRIEDNGNVLMGRTTDNGNRLQVDGGGYIARFNNHSGGDSGILLSRASNTAWGIVVSGGNLYLKDNTSGTTRLLLYENSQGGGAAFAGSLSVEGNTNITGNLVVTGGGAFGSDVRYKNIINYTNIDIATIANAPLFTYKWNDREDDKVYLGTTAQYWENTEFGGVVNATDPNFLKLDYGALAYGIGVMVARKVVDHEERIATLEKENRELKKKLNKYETLWHN